MSVSIQKEDFDVSKELLKLRENHRDIGAVVSFIGTVRDFNPDGFVFKMELEHYEEMTQKALISLLEDAKKRFPIIAARIIHRVGVLKPTEQIVLVAVATQHRQAAFLACEFIMNHIKSDVPIWKKESTEKGETWVKA